MSKPSNLDIRKKESGVWLSLEKDVKVLFWTDKFVFKFSVTNLPNRLYHKLFLLVVSSLVKSVR